MHSEVEQVIRDINPWWGRTEASPPPPFRRPFVREVAERVLGEGNIIEVLRGPRQVGKSTAMAQIVEDALRAGVAPERVCYLRFDLDILRRRGLLTDAVRWYVGAIRRRPLSDGPRSLFLLDEVHKLPGWPGEVKHLHEAGTAGLLLTGSASVLVARGSRESLAGRTRTTEALPFLFREVLEAWHPALVHGVPQLRCADLFGPDAPARLRAVREVVEPQRDAVAHLLDRYYQRGGYPRLYTGDVPEALWADYLVEAVFEKVLGVDIPDLFPVGHPALLRQVYLSVSRRTGQEVRQLDLTDELNASGYRTNQPTVGRYLHYLADAFLTREFRRFPVASRQAARVPVKVTLTDLGIRNALFRGVPSLWESAPEKVGPLVETLVQTVLRGHGIDVHYFRGRATPRDTRSPLLEVDFVLEDLEGRVVPVEVKFRRQVADDDLATIRWFMRAHRSPFGVVISRDTWQEIPEERLLVIPLADFLLAF